MGKPHAKKPPGIACTDGDTYSQGTHRLCVGEAPSVAPDIPLLIRRASSPPRYHFRVWISSPLLGPEYGVSPRHCSSRCRRRSRLDCCTPLRGAPQVVPRRVHRAGRRRAPGAPVGGVCESPGRGRRRAGRRRGDGHQPSLRGGVDRLHASVRTSSDHTMGEAMDSVV